MIRGEEIRPHAARPRPAAAAETSTMVAAPVANGEAEERQEADLRISYYHGVTSAEKGKLKHAKFSESAMEPKMQNLCQRSSR